MAYSGFYADEDLFEVAKNGDPDDGTWMLPVDQADEYPDDVFRIVGSGDDTKKLAIEVDGMDCVAVYERMKAFCDRCRETSRPGFVDMKTYRFKGHSMSDPRKYRTREEEAQYEADDPIGKLKTSLVSAGVLDEAAVKAMQKEIRAEVRASIEWSEASPAPGPEELYHDVYVEKWRPYTGTSDPEMLREGGER